MEASRIPQAVGAARPPRRVSTQESFGRLLTRLGDIDGVAERIVTVSPDVSVSTNLGGWINKTGVFSPEEQPYYFGDDIALRWKPTPRGQHLELGISEMNLFLMMGQLGLAHEHHGEMLLPIGTVYDPFVLRGLDAFIYGAYSDSRFIIVGTPSGISLAPEGGAHQSTMTASVGLELPGVDFCEPAFATALDWLLCDALRRLGDPSGSGMYLRLSTRPIDQEPFTSLEQAQSTEDLRSDVLAGGYRLRESSFPHFPQVILAGSGAVIPELLGAARDLEEEGVGATVLDITSLGRLYAQWSETLKASSRTATTPAEDYHLAKLIPRQSTNLVNRGPLPSSTVASDSCLARLSTLRSWDWQRRKLHRQSPGQNIARAVTGDPIPYRIRSGATKKRRLQRPDLRQAALSRPKSQTSTRQRPIATLPTSWMGCSTAAYPTGTTSFAASAATTATSRSRGQGRQAAWRPGRCNDSGSRTEFNALSRFSGLMRISVPRSSSTPQRPWALAESSVGASLWHGSRP